MTNTNIAPIGASDTSKKRLVPVTKWGNDHDWPSVAGLRWLIFNAKTNGFDRVIKRVGGRVLIDESAFYSWVETQNACTDVA